MTDSLQPAQVPVGVDPTKPSIARVYNAFLNGKDNYAVDRALKEKILQVAPEAAHVAFENRGFLIRACRFLAEQTGIDQFLDCGSGLPAAENVHEVVQRINPHATVVYIDNDPVVLAHGRAMLEDNDLTHLVGADIFKPQEVLQNEVVRKHIDFSKPLALLHFGTMHHINADIDVPAGIMKEYIDALPSGSYVGITHFLDPENEHSETARRIEQVMVNSPLGAGAFRPMRELEQLTEGLELVEPGWVRCVDWWPDGPRVKPLIGTQHCIAGAVGRKP
ncbi:SAM-dependent methyltransferase [Thermocrispum municipale]|jgi:hypothetical protein|uniref:SAM-dependent methyltransferase n=1 Tax=Thermocrispum municipale TaxID=37926 RepID=UPI000426E8B6|nr:SAM-dependent methyltransferase [Thermocrispum municipale]